MANNRELSQLGSIIVVDDSNRNLGIGTTDPNAVVGAGNTAKLSVGVVSAYQLFGDGSNLSGLTPSQVGALANVVEDTEPQLGGDLDVNGNDITGIGSVNLTGIITANTFSGSGSSLTNIPNSALDNSTVSYGGVQVSLGSSDATPAFDLSDATNYPYSSLTGITTEIVGDTTPQLGGDLDVNNNNITGTGNVNLIGIITANTFSGSGASLTNIPNAALDNSTVSYGGVSLSLGGTDTTPAFDLQDATNYPYTSLTGITTEIVGDTTPQLGGDLDVNNNNITGTGNVNLIGIVTATSFTGNLTGTATTATALETPRNFEITGDVIASAISFDGTGNVSLAATIQPNSVGLGTDTTGDYVASISGTANQIAVDVTSGEGTTPVISIPTNPTLPGTTVTIQNDLQVNRDLNVTGNITVGGTSGTLFTETLQVADADLILGVRTDANGNDVSTDTTASHGGIAIASTEGTPLITLVNPGAGETLPPTYKKIMWFEQGAFAGLGTDAWLINYGVGIGSTQVPNNVVLAAGDVHITNNDIKKVRDINATGIITALSFVKTSNNGGFLKADGTEDTSTYLTAESDTLDSVTTRGSTTTNDVSVGIITATKFVKSSGQSTEFLKADGSVDTNTYLTSETQTLDDVVGLGSDTTQTITVGTATTGIILRPDGTLNVSGVSTLGGVKISSGIITAVSGVVTYYGDGTYLSNIAPAGAIEGLTVIDQSGSTVGTSGSVTTLSFEGSTGVTVTATSGATGIATVLIEGGGDADTLGGISSTSFLRSDVADTKTSGNLTFSDGVSARFGDGEDLVIWHNAAHSYILHQGTGDLNIRNSNNDADVKIESDDGSGGSTSYFLADGSTGESILYHYGTEKLATKPGGVYVSGVITATSGFATTDGTSSQFLKADGSVDSSTYLTAESDTLDSVTTRGSTTTNDVSVGIITATKFVKSSNSGGFLKADGIEDTNTYLTSETQTLDDVVGLGSDTTQTITVGTATTGVVVRPDGTLNVSGISTIGNIEINANTIENTNAGAGLVLAAKDSLQLRVNSASSNLAMVGNNGGSVDLYYNNDKKFETTGIGISVLSGTGLTATIAGPSNLIIDPMPAGVGTTSGIVRIKGDLYVDGTTTQINSTTIELADFIVGIATTATSDLLADGAGIQIGPDNTFKYHYNGGTNPSLKSSENLNVAEGKAYLINQSSVLNATTLGTGVTNSSLTSLGTITTGTWQGTAINDDYIGTIDNTDKVSLSALNIDGGTDIGALLADGDLFIVDDGGGGTNRRADIVGLTTYTFGKVSGDIQISSTGTATIQANSVELTTDTTGNYVQSVSNGEGITGGNAGSEGASLTLALDINGLTNTETTLEDGDLFAIHELTNGRVEKITALNAKTYFSAGGSTYWVQNNVGIHTLSSVGIGTTNPQSKLEINVGTAVSAFDIQGSAGQLFSVTNNLTSGSIFSVNDVSGIPSIDVDADGTIQLAPYSTTEFVGVGTTNPTTKLHVIGEVTATDFNSTSDSRLKTNVQVIDDPLAKVLQINGVSFNWIENNKPSMGVIADNIEEVVPELVSDTDPKTVNYNGLIGLLIEVVKEQQTQIGSLNERLSRLE